LACGFKLEEPAKCLGRPGRIVQFGTRLAEDHQTMRFPPPLLHEALGPFSAAFSRTSWGKSSASASSASG
jgi:hypothetical protein